MALVELTGARRILDLGSATAGSVTSITVGPEIYKRMKVRPNIGNVLIAVVESPSDWWPPSGWTANGNAVWRLLVHPADLEAFWTFTFMTADEHRIHFVLAEPQDFTDGHGTWVG